jgi:hypothetical protein
VDEKKTTKIGRKAIRERTSKEWMKVDEKEQPKLAESFVKSDTEKKKNFLFDRACIDWLGWNLEPQLLYGPSPMNQIVVRTESLNCSRNINYWAIKWKLV